MEINYYHEYSEVYCERCGYDGVDPFNETRCDMCMAPFGMNFVCELCMDMYSLEENMEVCPIYIESVIKINKFFKNILKKRKLKIYAESLIDKYYNPKSKYIEYIVDNFNNDNNIKELVYIDINNNLKRFKIRK
jgi:hypothetical protein